MSQISFYELSDIDGLLGMRRIVIALFNPDWVILPEGMKAILETIFIAFMATLLAVPLAFIASFLCAKNVMGSTVLGFSVYMFLRTVFNITRSIEPLIWAIIFTVWVGIGPFAGMLGLMLHSVAALAKQYSELIECVEDGPIDGITSTGAKPLQVIWFAIFSSSITSLYFFHNLPLGYQCENGNSCWNYGRRRYWYLTDSICWTRNVERSGLLDNIDCHCRMEFRYSLYLH